MCSRLVLRPTGKPLGHWGTILRRGEWGSLQTLITSPTAAVSKKPDLRIFPASWHANEITPSHMSTCPHGRLPSCDVAREPSTRGWPDETVDLGLQTWVFVTVNLHKQLFSVCYQASGILICQQEIEQDENGAQVFLGGCHCHPKAFWLWELVRWSRQPGTVAHAYNPRTPKKKKDGLGCIAAAILIFILWLLFHYFSEYLSS